MLRNPNILFATFLHVNAKTIPKPKTTLRLPADFMNPPKVGFAKFIFRGYEYERNEV